MKMETRKSTIMNSELKTRAENDDMVIEGYFAVFNSPTELFRGAFEEIDSGAFDNTLSNDVRALIDHDHRLVLGRSKAGTLSLRTDSRGLWGTINVNPKDTDAVNLYERVQRGDVDQCSFGFNIREEETEFNDDGTIKWTLKDVELFEVSVVTFPAYGDTSVQARKNDLEQHKRRQLELRKKKLRERLKNGFKTVVTE
ncbi:hypothetical protein DFO70_11138 [Cytobacillus firmus]|uniref:Prohead serine protease domain-containing protein n=2 Tax=Cytobacillus TaxID=2675230 RepID=A0A366JN95_CYTFI|nr:MULTISPECIES: HK97 family phage prohead protease [Cytobacillus]RBP89391.1 hypothetical protein DFO70_11138 [Cytobacillus firmus]TDX47382.1 hypothetical protein DFO72_101479 [Cytobacillus oceanisediminis]